MDIARSMKAAVAAAVFAAGAVAGTPAWAERGHDRHGHGHRHHKHGHNDHEVGRSNAAALLGFGLLVGALAVALSEPQPAPRVVYASPTEVYPPPAPPVYIERGTLYCPAPAGHYPDVTHCPSGWARVLPPG